MKKTMSAPRQEVPRRSFLKMGAAAGLAMAAPAAATAAPYIVGVGRSAAAYDAARQAATAGQFPSKLIANRTVVLKVNLVIGQPSTSGVTTDPEVTRAIVDLCLSAGASKIQIVEGSANAASNFSVCGYDFFSSYDPQGRIQLIDLLTDSLIVSPVPTGYSFTNLYLPATVMQPGAAFISIAKLKTHNKVRASLTCKNLIGALPPSAYQLPGSPRRDDIHSRGIDFGICDVNFARPIHFAVIDGIVGQEGEGPTQGQPIETDLVIAGRNALAVDRVGTNVMGFDAGYLPQYFTYLSQRNFGPSDLSSVQLTGYQYSRSAFQRPDGFPGVLWLSPASPTQFAAGQTTSISYRIPQETTVQVEIDTDNDATPSMKLVTVLQPSVTQAAGTYRVKWDGRDAGGNFVAPGNYLARAVYSKPGGIVTGSPTAWVTFLG